MQYFRYISFLFVFTACTKDTVTNDYINIEKDIELSLSQNVNDSGSYTELIITTYDSVDCKNTLLIVDQKINANSIEIYINGLSKSGSCINGKTKPIAYNNIGYTIDDQNIAFILKNNIKNEGNLFLNGNNIELNLDLPKGLAVKTNRIIKLPGNTVWGFLNSNTSKALTDFQAIINKHKKTSYFPEAGNYGLFQYFNDADIRLTDKKIGSSEGANKKFYFQFENWDNFMSDVKLFKSTYPDAIISARNFKDKSL
jgi:hypothetical protein